jgi:hypothetical protein
MAGRAPTGVSADLKTCDKGLVRDAKTKKCTIKRSDAAPENDLTTCFPRRVGYKGKQCLQRRGGTRR